MPGILILGVGNAQVDAIRWCRNAGYEVFGIGWKNEGRGRLLADHFEVLDIADRESVLRYASDNNIRLVYSVGSDIAMPTAGYVSRELGLPFFVKPETAEILNDKAELRTFLNNNGFRTVHFSRARTPHDLSDWKSYPSVMKPVDSQGQRGVYRVDNEEEMRKFFHASRSFSRSGEVIIEEYVYGDEVSVIGFLVNGKMIHLFVIDRLVTEGPPEGNPRAHRIPASVGADLSKKISRTANVAARKLGIENGPLYFQMKHAGDEVCIIEIAGRLDGCHLWRLIRLWFGIDLLDMTFGLLLNKRVDQVAGERERKKAGLCIRYFLQKPGEPFIPVAESDVNTVYTKFFYEPGQRVLEVNGFAERVGYAITEVC